MIFDIEQGSEGWLKLRAGVFTSTSANDLTSKDIRNGNCHTHAKNKITKKSEEENQYSCGCPITYRWSEGRVKLYDRIIEERHTGEVSESITFGGSRVTDRGNDKEPEARQDFEFTTRLKVDEVGFVTLPNDKSWGDEPIWVGISPDGLIKEDSGLEIKSPIYNTQRHRLKFYNKNRHLSDNELLSQISKDYYTQVQMCLYTTIRECWYFYSYHPKLDPVMLKITRDEPLITSIKNKIAEARQYINNELKLLRGG